MMLEGVLLMTIGSALLPTQDWVDLASYAGRWYEIARLPNRFQEQCAGDVAANYTLRPDGRVAVVNECRRRDGQTTRAEGVARLADEQGPASRLKVRFAPAWLSFLPFVWGDYWILELDPDYRHALVGDPSRKYLWILSRSPALDAATYESLAALADRLGFDTPRLVRTSHSSR
jgi:apolipoprotein D and lipocalin family protein